MNARFALAATAAATIFAFAGPATAQQATAEAPSTYSGPNRAMLTTGLLTVAASYTPAVIVASTSPRPEDKWLYVPVAGPWMDLANRSSCEAAGIPCSRENLYRAGLIATGVAHAVGVGLVVASFLSPERPTAATVTAGRVQVTPAAMGIGGYGLAAIGSF